MLQDVWLQALSIFHINTTSLLCCSCWDWLTTQTLLYMNCVLQCCTFIWNLPCTATLHVRRSLTLPWQRGLVVEYIYLITEGYQLGNVLMTLIGFTSMASVPREKLSHTFKKWEVMATDVVGFAGSLIPRPLALLAHGIGMRLLPR